MHALKNFSSFDKNKINFQFFFCILGQSFFVRVLGQKFPKIENERKTPVAKQGGEKEKAMGKNTEDGIKKKFITLAIVTKKLALAILSFSDRACSQIKFSPRRY